MKWVLKILVGSVQAFHRYRLSTGLASALVILSIVVVSVWVPAKKVNAADFTMQTGYYIGTGSAGLAITGVGFQADFLMIRAVNATSAAVFKTTSMPANTIAFTSGTTHNTGTNITLDSDGFTVGTLANVNTVNIMYYWVAVDGSDCSATGNFCEGTYTGNGTGNRNITVGFQPTMTLIKRNNTDPGHFRVNSQPANETVFLNQTLRNTTGIYIRSFAATTFQVGTTDNTNTAVYYYVAFRDTAGKFAQGTYAGNSTDNRSFGGLGIAPDFLLTKNATNATAANVRPVMNFTESFGDMSTYVGDTQASTANHVQALEAAGFQVGTTNQVNLTGDTYYWFAFSGAPDYSSSGSFEMATGSYVGTGASNPRSGLGFSPDLVIIKANTNQLGVFRTTMMKGDITAYLSNNVANFAGGITSLDGDGFTVGTATQTNTLGVTYQWQAFGNAYNPYDNDGAADFAVGTYYGNGIDSRNIGRTPWQPNMVTIKTNAADVGVWKPSSLAGDSAAYFGATATAANVVQAFNSDGFQVGNNNQANRNVTLIHWFAFKTGSNFAVGSYTGSGVAQSITSAGLRAENVWVKRSTAVNGVQHNVSLSGDNTQYFVATANAADRITRFVKGGFRVGGAQTETNTNGGTYYYAAWNDADYGSLGIDIVNGSDQSVASPSFALSSKALSFDCSSIDGNLGDASQKIRISNLTTSAAWDVTIAATAGNTELWRNVGDTEQYDYNDSGGTPNGCTDSGDADSEAGQLTIDPTPATNTPETGCATSNISLGSSAAYSQSVTDAITLISASASADADCMWDITNIDIDQFIPAEQPIGDYDINLTITIVAS